MGGLNASRLQLYIKPHSEKARSTILGSWSDPNSQRASQDHNIQNSSPNLDLMIKKHQDENFIPLMA